MLKLSLLLSLVASGVLAQGTYKAPAVWECDAPGTEGLFISDTAVTFKNAARACAKNGGELADITNKNFLLATDLVLHCVGKNQNSWINSWDYNPLNPQKRECLAIYTGSFGPGGGIDMNCKGRRYAVCSVKKKPVKSSVSVSRTRTRTIVPTVVTDPAPSTVTSVIETPTAVTDPAPSTVTSVVETPTVIEDRAPSTVVSSVTTSTPVETAIIDPVQADNNAEYSVVPIDNESAESP